MYYYPFNIADYKASTAHLSNDEDLAFRRLLDMYYDTEMPIPLDSAWLARRIRVSVEAIESVLIDMFEKKEDGYHHARCDAEILKYQGFAESGKRGAAIRWSKGGDGGAIGTPSNPISNQNKNQNNNKNNKEHIFVVPDWIPKDAWQGFIEMRKAGKGAFTDRAKQLIVNQLKTLHFEGQDVAKVLDQSTANGWKGVFPLKTQQGATNGKFNVHAYTREKLARELAAEAVGNRAAQEVFNVVPTEIHKLFSGSGNGE